MRTVVFVAALVALGSALAAQTIDSVQPSSGSIGTRVTITGSDFGDKPPKVWLGQDDSKKKTKLKVVSLSDTEIVAELKKAKQAATFDVFVQKKGKGFDPVSSAGAFDVPAPSVEGVEPAGEAVAITPGGLATIDGAAFGAKKPKVKVGGKGAKVVELSDTSLTIVVSKGLYAGMHDIELRTKVGTVEIAAAVPLVGGKKTLGSPGTGSYRVGKTKVAVSGLFGLLVTSSDGATQVTAGQEGLPSYRLELDLPVASLDEEVPVAFVDDESATMTLTYSEGLFGPITTWQSDGDLDVRIQSVVDGVATIEFSGTLTRTSGEAGAATVEITDGVANPTGV